MRAARHDAGMGAVSARRIEGRSPPSGEAPETLTWGAGVAWLAAHELRRVVRDRVAFFWLLVLPLLFTWLVTLVFGTGQSAGGTQAAYRLPVADLDGSALSRELVGFLQKDPTVRVEHRTRAEVERMVEQRDVRVALVIPAGFEESLGGGAGALQVVTRPGEIGADPRQFAIEEAAQRLSTLVTSARAAEIAAGMSTAEALETARAMLARASLVRVDVEPVGAAGSRVGTPRAVPSGAEQASPGFTVMFVLLGTVTAAGSVARDRRHGILARLLCSPLTPGQVLASHVGAIMVQGAVQLGILIMAGQWLFGVNWGRSPQALAALSAAYLFAAASMGLLLVGLVRTEAQAGSLGVLFVILLSLLGGAWWPPEMVAPVMQVVADMLPTGWAMQGFLDIVLRGASFQSVRSEVLALVTFGVVAFGVAGMRIRRELQAR